MKIAVYGSAAGSLHDSVKEKARELGREIARRGHILVTGACSGFPQEAVLGAHELSGECIGFSPARNMQEHTEHGFPVKGFTHIRFVPASYEHANNPTICKKYRNISSVAFVDAGIIVGGRTGTLNEFTLLYDFGKLIGVLEGTGGITHRALKIILEDIDKDMGAQIVFEKEPTVLVRRLEEMHG